MNLTFTTKNVIALTKYYDRNHNTTNHYIVYLYSSFYAIFKLNTTNQKKYYEKNSIHLRSGISGPELFKKKYYNTN